MRDYYKYYLIENAHERSYETNCSTCKHSKKWSGNLAHAFALSFFPAYAHLCRVKQYINFLMKRSPEKNTSPNDGTVLFEYSTKF